MTVHSHDNMLVLIDQPLHSVRLLDGQPYRKIVKPSVQGLLFERGQVWAYVAVSGQSVSAWIVKNEPGTECLPYLKKPVTVLVEAMGSLRVKRLITTLQLIKKHDLSVSDLEVQTLIHWDSLLAAKRYDAAWVLQKVSHEKP